MPRNSSRLNIPHVSSQKNGMVRKASKVSFEDQKEDSRIVSKRGTTLQ